jgi:hypothetical protein
MRRNDQWESDEQTGLLDPSINFLPDWGDERPRRRRRPEPPPADEPAPEPVIEECLPDQPPALPDPVIEQARGEASQVVVHQHHTHGLSGVTLVLTVACSVLAGGLAVAVLERTLSRPVAAPPQADRPAQSELAALTVLMQRAEAAANEAAAAKSEIASLKVLLERERSASEAIAERLARIEEGIKEGRAGHATELKLLSEKVGVLERDARKLEPIPLLVRSVKEDLDRSVDKIEGRLALLQEERRWKTFRTPYPEAADPADVLLKRGAALYARGEFAAAREVFLGLTEAFPSDARGWYYAALSNAFVTRVWSGGETTTLFEKGADCERKGATDSARIDATFASLGQPGGKDWLAYYRPRDRGPGSAP